METTVKVKRKVINGYHPVSRATIVVGKLLSQDEHQTSIGKLTQDFLPVKEEISKTVRKYCTTHTFLRLSSLSRAKSSTSAFPAPSRVR